LVSGGLEIKEENCGGAAPMPTIEVLMDVKAASVFRQILRQEGSEYNYNCIEVF
jgi:hypothetical protein